MENDPFSGNMLSKISQVAQEMVRRSRAHEYHVGQRLGEQIFHDLIVWSSPTVI